MSQNIKLIDNYQCKSILSLLKVTSLIVLKNKEDVVSISECSNIIIFDLKFYKIKLFINQFKDNYTLLDVQELKNNKLIITCWDRTITIIQLLEKNTKYEIFQCLNDHQLNALAIIILKSFEDEKYLASSSTDTSVIIWKKNKDDKYECFTKLKDTHSQIESITESKKHKKLISGSAKGRIICFYDLKTFKLICKLEGISINRCIRALQMINDDFLIGAGNYAIYLFNITTHQYIKSFENNFELENNCVYLMKNGNILISNYLKYNKCANISQYFFDEENQNLVKISSHQLMHKKYITSILELENNDIITCGYDGLIKIWTY
jgi:WD40 repeat protein